MARRTESGFFFQTLQKRFPKIQEKYILGKKDFHPSEALAKNNFIRVDKNSKLILGNEFFRSDSVSLTPRG